MPSVLRHTYISVTQNRRHYYIIAKDYNGMFHKLNIPRILAHIYSVVCTNTKHIETRKVQLKSGQYFKY